MAVFVPYIRPKWNKTYYHNDHVLSLGVLKIQSNPIQVKTYSNSFVGDHVVANLFFLSFNTLKIQFCH